MKLLVLACLVSLAFCIFPTHEVESLFGEYMAKYNKVYTAEEYTTRFSNFQASLVRIQVLNANSDSTRFGINQFADMSAEEFRKTVLMRQTITEFDNTPYMNRAFVHNESLGAALDWRTKGAVTPVKNQGQCGSCWAFSATEAIESAWILGGHATASTVDLAPQQIVDCDHQGVSGCNGGTTESAYNYIHSSGGQDSTAHYPYTARDGTCKFSSAYVVAKITTYKSATRRGDENTLEANLNSWGPLSICVDAANWQHYVSGVMSANTCCTTCRLDHCVQLVGYDTSSAPAYWIVRNSWGASWGIQGYIHLAMGGNTCGLTDDATWPTL